MNLSDITEEEEVKIPPKDLTGNFRCLNYSFYRAGQTRLCGLGH